MKRILNKLSILVSLLCAIIGVLGIISAIVLWYSGDDMKKWIGAIIVSVLLIISGVFDIERKLKNKSQEKDKSEVLMDKEKQEEIMTFISDI